MLERSGAAKHAKAKFFEKFNDIDVFVEDTAKESKKVYCELLSRALGNQVTVTQVFPIGSKEIVIARCAADQGPRSRRAVYIVDGDYDLLNGVPNAGLRRLFRLPRYSVENFLCDEDALIDVIADESIKEDRLQVLAKFDFDGWAAKVATPLAELLIACFAAHRFQVGLPTVNIKLANICGAKPDHIDCTKVTALVEVYATAIDTKHGAGVFGACKAGVDSHRPTNDYEFVLRYAPAKTFLFPLLVGRATRRHGLGLNERLLRCKIARRCDVTELKGIGAAIS